MSKDGFNYEKTPTNVQHIEGFLMKNAAIKGITLNSNLYTSMEDGNNSQKGDEEVPFARNQESNSSTRYETNKSGKII
jgi:hypothetical protein